MQTFNASVESTPEWPPERGTCGRECAPSGTRVDTHTGGVDLPGLCAWEPAHMPSRPALRSLHAATLV